ncbi:MAG: hypothetical protein ACRCUE_04660 [Bosea sp. (in: a-proteobacteria)]
MTSVSVHDVRTRTGWRFSVVCVLVLVSLSLLLLALPIRLPIGPNYWDVYLFIDVAHRIDLGQLPHIDFFVPIGALPFYLHDIVQWFFPNAQPVLAVQYATLLISAPLALWVSIEIERTSRVTAIGFLVPFALFSLLPFNIIEFYPAPGIDGFGIYNRQAGLLLYLLVGALVLCDSRHLKVAVAAVVLCALLFIKVTAGLAAASVILISVVSGRMRSADALAVFGTALVVTVGLQLTTGLPQAYLGDLIGLVEDNTDSLAERVLTFVSLKFDVLLGVALFGLYALWLDRKRLYRAVGHLFGTGALVSPARMVALRWIVRHPVALLGALALMATGYETQNTGSNEFIYLWPVILMLLSLYGPRLDGMALTVFIVLACTAALPSLVKVVHKAVRTIAVAPGYKPVARGLAGPLAMTVTKPVYDARADVLAQHYAEQREAWAALATSGQKPSAIQYSEPDYQTFYVRSIAEAADAIRRMEAVSGSRFETMHVLDFVDPLTPELKRVPPRFVSVANDPDRTYPVRIRDKVARELASMDALLIPRCPVTPARLSILKAAEPALASRQIVRLSRCWDIAIKSVLPVDLAMNMPAGSAH